MPLGAETTLRRVAASKGAPAGLRARGIRRRRGALPENQPRGRLPALERRDGDAGRAAACPEIRRSRRRPSSPASAQLTGRGAGSGRCWAGALRSSTPPTIRRARASWIPTFRASSRDQAPARRDRWGARSREGGPTPRGPMQALPGDPPCCASSGEGIEPRRA